MSDRDPRIVNQTGLLFPPYGKKGKSTLPVVQRVAICNSCSAEYSRQWIGTTCSECDGTIRETLVQRDARGGAK